LSAASTYAEALFEAALERGELERTLEDLQGFQADLNSSQELSTFFYGTHITEGEKRRAVDALTEGSSLSARNFLKVLVDNSREELLDDVLVNYEELVEEHLGRVEVEITTAVELSDEETQRIRHRLGKMMEGKEVILQNRVDPDILGGVVFRFGGRLVDSSVRGHLRGLREKMVERGVV
jgi:F-type H+-transporting ATPase subunit delta